MEKISIFAAASDKHVAEVDLNPVLVHRPGEGISIVDALVGSGDGFELAQMHVSRIPKSARTPEETAVSILAGGVFVVAVVIAARAERRNDR